MKVCPSRHDFIAKIQPEVIIVIPANAKIVKIPV